MASLSLEQFVEEYVAACREELTSRELAERLGYKIGTLQQRVYETRKKMAAEGVELPRLKSSRPEHGATKRALAVLERLGILPTMQPESDEKPAKKQRAKKKKDSTDGALSPEPTLDKEDQDELDAIFS